MPNHARSYASLPTMRLVFAAGLLITLSPFASAQQDDTGGTTDTSATGGGNVFQPEEVDLSVFDAVERSDSIGTAATQGFGLGAGTTGGTTGRGGGGGGGGFGGLGGLFGGLGGAFGGQGGTSQRPIIRVRLRSAIDIPPRPQEEVQRMVSTRLSAISPSSGVQGVSVTMDGGTAILTGAVASEKQRRMSELLMRLEPGVRSVDNRVTVGN